MLLTKNDPSLRTPTATSPKAIAFKAETFKAFTIDRLADICGLDGLDDVTDDPDTDTADLKDLLDTDQLTDAAVDLARVFNVRPTRLVEWMERALTIERWEEPVTVTRSDGTDVTYMKQRGRYIGLNPMKIAEVTAAERATLEAHEAACRRVLPFRDMVRAIRATPDGTTTAIEAVFAQLDEGDRAAMRGIVDAYLLAADLGIEMRRLLGVAQESAIAELARRIADESMLATTTEVW